LGGGYLALERPRATESPAQLALGRTLYDENCAACHGTELEGQANWRQRKPDGLLPAPPHDQSGHTWHHPDGQLFEITKRGTAALVGSDYRTAMGPFGAVLSDDEIRAVLDYIKSRWPENIRARQAGITERAGN
jgi:mono/diheme cytochrome c family protein